jgi:hypothetical protein
MKGSGRGFLRWTRAIEDRNVTHGNLTEFCTDVSTILVYDTIITTLSQIFHLKTVVRITNFWILWGQIQRIMQNNK